MNNGKIFEACLFGYEDREDIKDLCFTKAGKNNADMVRLKPLALKCRKYVPSEVHHQRLNLDCGDFILSGEPDYQGVLINPNNGEIYEDCNVDIKLTGDICKIWDWKQTKSDFFQSVSYTYLDYKLTGKKRRFFYLIVQDCDFEIPLIRIIEVTIKDSDLLWFEKLIMTASTDLFCDPNKAECLGKSRYEPPCRWLENCEYGRDVIGGTHQIMFESLSSDFEPDLSGSFEDVTNVKSKTFMDLPVTEELEETRFDDIEKGLFKQITMLRSEKRENGYRCRNCRTVAIQDDDKECPNCKAKIMWLEE